MVLLLFSEIMASNVSNLNIRHPLHINYAYMKILGWLFHQKGIGIR